MDNNTDLSTLAKLTKQAENLVRLEIFDELTSSMNIRCLSDFLDEYSRLLLYSESLEEISKVLASKAISYFNLSTLEVAIRTSKGTRGLISAIMQKIKESKA